MTGIETSSETRPASLGAALPAVGCAIAASIVVAVYASLAGLRLRPASAVAVAAAMPLAWLAARWLTTGRSRLKPTRIASAYLIAAVAGWWIANDVYNRDILWQVSLVEQAQYFDRLTTPAFYGSAYSTKYDGWIWLLASLSRITGIPAAALVRHANVLLYPFLLALAWRAVRLFGMSRVHVIAAMGLAILVGSDELRLIAMGGPRTTAALLQITAVLLFVEGVMTPARPARTFNILMFSAGLCLAASGLAHNFFALANTILAASLLLVGAARRGGTASSLRALIWFGVPYLALVLPYVAIKRAAIPVEALVDPLQPVSAWMADWRILFGTQWGEHLSPLPYWAVLALMLWRPKRADAPEIDRSMREWLVLGSLFLVPAALLAAPATSRLLVAVISESRVSRVFPLCAPLLAWATYAYCVGCWRSGRGLPWRRAAVMAVAAVAIVSAVPIAAQAASWYRRGWADSRREINHDDKDYISVGIFVGVGLSRGEAVLAGSRLQALKIASAVRGYKVYFHDETGTVRYATHLDTYPAGEAVPEFTFGVRSRNAAVAVGDDVIFASGQLEVYDPRRAGAAPAIVAAMNTLHNPSSARDPRAGVTPPTVRVNGRPIVAAGEVSPRAPLMISNGRLRLSLVSTGEQQGGILAELATAAGWVPATSSYYGDWTFVDSSVNSGPTRAEILRLDAEEVHVRWTFGRHEAGPASQRRHVYPFSKDVWLRPDDTGYFALIEPLRPLPEGAWYGGNISEHEIGFGGIWGAGDVAAFAGELRTDLVEPNFVEINPAERPDAAELIRDGDTLRRVLVPLMRTHMIVPAFGGPNFGGVFIHRHTPGPVAAYLYVSEIGLGLSAREVCARAWRSSPVRLSQVTDAELASCGPAPDWSGAQ
jgi:hypothetical protein